MPAKPDHPDYPSPADLREILPTVTGNCVAGDPFATRLHYIADLLAALGEPPAQAILAWREADNKVLHLPIGRELFVGRQTGNTGLSLPGDDLLSRRHFVIQNQGTSFTLQDLDSRNGTALKTSENRINKETLCDGDLIYAGRHIFVYLNPARP